MNDNQMPELPKTNDNNNQVVNPTPIVEPNVASADPVVLQTIPEEEKKDSETMKMVNDVKETAVKEANSIFKFLKDVFKYITTRNSSDLMALLWRLLLIAGFVLVFELPFTLLKELGENIFILFGINYTVSLRNLWESIWIILYVIIGIVLFFVLCKDRYYKLVKSQNDTKEIIKEENK